MRLSTVMVSWHRCNGKTDMAFKSLKKRWAADFVTTLVAGYDDSLWAGPLPGPLAVRATKAEHSKSDTMQKNQISTQATRTSPSVGAFSLSRLLNLLSPRRRVGASCLTPHAQWVRKIRLRLLGASLVLAAAWSAVAQSEPEVISIDPHPGTVVLQLTFLNINFNEAVIG